MDFLISPPYAVPPMMMSRSAKLTTMNVPDLVPSSAGFA